MKLLTLLFTLLLLAGCSTEQQTDSEQDTSAVVSNEDSKEEESVPEEELNEAEVIDNLTEYPETVIMQEEIDLTSLTGYIISDNPGTRILIFTNEGKQVYKSILVKDERHLKVIDLEQNDLVIDETLPAF